MVVEEIQRSFNSVAQEIVFYLPRVVAALIILIIGWIVGKAAGRLAAGLLDRMGVDDAVEKTFLGDMIKRAGMTVRGVFDALVRWFIYIIFIVAAINVLDIPALTLLLSRFVLYLPQLIVGILVLVVGLILVNFIMNWIGRELVSNRVAFADIITIALKAFFSLVIIILALDQMLIDTTIIYTFLVPIAWGIGVGLALAVGIGVGWGSKDAVSEYLREKRPAIEQEVARKAHEHTPPE
jgi:Mechanosensitive ion channel, conserved TM helix